MSGKSFHCRGVYWRHVPPSGERADDTDMWVADIGQVSMTISHRLREEDDQPTIPAEYEIYCHGLGDEFDVGEVLNSDSVHSSPYEAATHWDCVAQEALDMAALYWSDFIDREYEESKMTYKRIGREMSLDIKRNSEPFELQRDASMRLTRFRIGQRHATPLEDARLEDSDLIVLAAEMGKEWMDLALAQDIVCRRMRRSVIDYIEHGVWDIPGDKRLESLLSAVLRHLAR